MTLYEPACLAMILETARLHGWALPHQADHWMLQDLEDCTVVAFLRDSRIVAYRSAIHLLFCCELELLRSACGENYLALAEGAMMLPDDEKLPFVASHLRSD